MKLYIILFHNGYICGECRTACSLHKIPLPLFGLVSKIWNKKSEQNVTKWRREEKNEHEKIRSEHQAYINLWNENKYLLWRSWMKKVASKTHNWKNFEATRSHPWWFPLLPLKLTRILTGKSLVSLISKISAERPQLKILNFSASLSFSSIHDW